MSTALRSALISFVKVILLSIIPIVIAQLTANEFDWRVIAVAGAIAGLKFIEKFISVRNDIGL